ncbi:MAG: class I SAM-dependent methyltransferase [Candidatus Sericytochromatia bacterium]|nr:class I SAM-dependent methyltransferase [Candidatus Sericytochromatia bacterium]
MTVGDVEGCDLCGSPAFKTVIHTRSGRSLRSDFQVLTEDLVKYECDRCGLVRNGSRLDPTAISATYADEYQLIDQDVFYTVNGSVSRAAVFAEHIAAACQQTGREPLGRFLEIGASHGGLLTEMGRRFPNARFEGLELNHRVAAGARQTGHTIYDHPLETLDVGLFDGMIAIAVLEHTISPTAFLRDLHRRTKPGGLVILSQPTQDIDSHDICFADHLYHFGTGHLHAYAQKCGFTEVLTVIGLTQVPSYSLHLLLAEDVPQTYEWPGPPQRSRCVASFQQIESDLTKLGRTLTRLVQGERRVAVFGVREFFAVANAYSRLAAFPIVCGLDDYPEHVADKIYPFPIVRPEEAAAFGITDVLLTMNKVHYPIAIARLQQLGLAGHEVFH